MVDNYHGFRRTAFFSGDLDCLLQSGAAGGTVEQELWPLDMETRVAQHPQMISVSVKQVHRPTPIILHALWENKNKVLSFCHFCQFLSKCAPKCANVCGPYFLSDKFESCLPVARNPIDHLTTSSGGKKREIQVIWLWDDDDDGE